MCQKRYELNEQILLWTFFLFPKKPTNFQLGKTLKKKPFETRPIRKSKWTPPELGPVRIF